MLQLDMSGAERRRLKTHLGTLPALKMCLMKTTLVVLCDLHKYAFTTELSLTLFLTILKSLTLLRGPHQLAPRDGQMNAELKP